jgi:glycosylphosphatidylinositol transamidase (GPIT) subunit GPI8
VVVVVDTCCANAFESKSNRSTVKQSNESVIDESALAGEQHWLCGATTEHVIVIIIEPIE